MTTIAEIAEKLDQLFAECSARLDAPRWVSREMLGLMQDRKGEEEVIAAIRAIHSHIVEAQVLCDGLRARL